MQHYEGSIGNGRVHHAMACWMERVFGTSTFGSEVVEDKMEGGWLEGGSTMIGVIGSGILETMAG